MKKAVFVIAVCTVALAVYAQVPIDPVLVEGAAGAKQVESGKPGAVHCGGSGKTARVVQRGNSPVSKK